MRDKRERLHDWRDDPEEEAPPIVVVAWALSVAGFVVIGLALLRII